MIEALSAPVDTRFFAKSDSIIRGPTVLLKCLQDGAVDHIDDVTSVAVVAKVSLRSLGVGNFFFKIEMASDSVNIF